MGDLEEHYNKVAEIPHRYKRRDSSKLEVVTFLRDIDLADYISQKDSVLEVGCGQGNFLVDVRNKYGANVTGLDMFRPEALEDIPFVQGDAESLPFRDDSFDFVFSYFTFQYLPDKLKALAEIHRVLRKGKRAIIDFGNLDPSVESLLDTYVSPCLSQIVSEMGIEEQVKCECVWVVNKNKPIPRRANRVILTKRTKSLSFLKLQYFRTQEGNFPFAYSYY